MTKRFSMYCFYDKDGIVGEYVFYYLKALKEVSEFLYVIVNGCINENDRTKLLTIANRVDIRENYGYDAYAYKHALNECKNILPEYDELILSNNSFYGPLYPLTNMFECMENRDKRSSNASNIDFWGITIHLRSDSILSHKQKLPYINEHIQSYFVVFKRQVFLSNTFANFFHNLPAIDKFSDAVVLFELELTRVLSEEGHFGYASYVNPTGFPNGNCTLTYPYDLYHDGKSPFVKRKAFFEDYHDFISKNRGNQSRKLLDELKASSSYPVELIWNDLLRTQRMSVLRENLHLCSIIDGSEPCSLTENEKTPKVALILYIYYEDQVETCLKDALKLVSMADAYIVSSSNDTLEKARDLFLGRGFRKIEFILKQDKGRDVSSYLIDAKFVFEHYDYVCYFHDPHNPQLANKYAVRDFYEHCVGSILDSNYFAIRVIREFEKNPKLGLLVPPPQNWGTFYASEYNLHPQNKELMNKLIKELKLNVPFDDFPIAPYGNFFWIRSVAIKPLFNKNWTYDDLPGEPIPNDGTILQALERIIPFCVQSAGYYASWLNSPSTQRLYTDNCYHYTKMFNQSMFKIFHFCDLPTMRYFLTQFAKKQYKNIKSKYYKYIILDFITLGAVAKFRRKKLKIKQILKE